MPAKMKLRSAYDSLPAAEKKVAAFILEDPDRAMHMVINEIADEAGVSVPSVTRLARKLGYKGFLEFRIALASGAALNGGAPKAEAIRDDDSDETVIQKLYNASVKAIEDTYYALDKGRFIELANRIVEAERVFLCGSENSTLIALDATLQLDSIGIEAVSITNPTVMNMYMNRFKSSDIVIGFSRGGRDRRLAEAIRAAKARGATTVFLSNFVGAQSAQTADYFFCTSRIEDVKALTGRESSNSMIALTNMLIVLVARKLNKPIRESELIIQ